MFCKHKYFHIADGSKFHSALLFNNYSVFPNMLLKAIVPSEQHYERLYLKLKWLTYFKENLGYSNFTLQDFRFSSTWRLRSSCCNI